MNAWSIIDDRLREQLLRLVSEPIADNEIEPFKNVKRLYQGCMNLAVIESLGATPLDTVLSAMGTWPVSNAAWSGAGWTWQANAAVARQLGFSIDDFFFLSVAIDNRHSSRRIITVEESEN